MTTIKPARPSVPPTTVSLSAAMLSAALTASAPSLAETREMASPAQILWGSPDASSPSFQGLGVLHGTTLPTTKAVPTDPWQELETLPPNWDGEGAPTISQAAIENAKRFLQGLTPAAGTFRPFAYPDGGIGLESQKKGKEAYLVVSESGRFTYVIQIGKTVHRGDDVDAAKMQELLAFLY